MTYLIESPLVGRYGGLEFPLNANDFDSTLVNLDPARSKLAALFTAAINAELGAVWAKVNLLTTPIKNSLPVQTTLELEPTANTLRQVKTGFPLLSIHRVGDQTWSEHTMEVDKCEQDWNLHYILPALDVGDQRRIVDVLRIIPEIIRRVIRARGHQSYDGGQLQFFAEKGGLGSVKITKAESGQSKFGDDNGPIYWATTITLQTVEYGSDSEQEFGEFEGIDWTIGVGNNTGIQPDVIQAYSDVPLLNGDE